MESVPRVDKAADVQGKSRLKTIEGFVPDPLRFPTGCRFHPRCPLAFDKCKTNDPELEEISPNHLSRCFLAKELLNGTK